MQYLSIEHLKPGMKLAKAIMGDDGRLLVNAGNQISETVLKRMTAMGFQGAYIDTPGFEDIIIDFAGFIWPLGRVVDAWYCCVDNYTTCLFFCSNRCHGK